MYLYSLAPTHTQWATELGREPDPVSEPCAKT